MIDPQNVIDLLTHDVGTGTGIAARLIEQSISVTAIIDLEFLEYSGGDGRFDGDLSNCLNS